VKIVVTRHSGLVGGCGLNAKPRRFGRGVVRKAWFESCKLGAVQPGAKCVVGFESPFFVKYCEDEVYEAGLNAKPRRLSRGRDGVEILRFWLRQNDDSYQYFFLF
jgi:hypothetical protein